MSTVEGVVFFDRVIDDAATAAAVFELAEEAGWKLGKIGSYDPLRTPYSRDAVLEQLAEGVRGGTPCWTFYAKGSKPRVRVLLTFCRPLEPGAGALNRVLFEWSGGGVSGGQDVERLVASAFDIPAAAYGYVTPSERREAQHTTGTINQRIPGVFYMNLFGPAYVRLFGDRLLEYRWERSEQSAGRFTGWLFSSLTDALDDNAARVREADAKESLGHGFFDGSAAVPRLAVG